MISEAMLAEARTIAGITVVGEPQAMKFDAAGNLVREED